MKEYVSRPLKKQYDLGEGKENRVIMVIPIENNATKCRSIFHWHMGKSNFFLFLTAYKLFMSRTHRESDVRNTSAKQFGLFLLICERNFLT